MEVPEIIEKIKNLKINPETDERKVLLNASLAFGDEFEGAMQKLLDYFSEMPIDENEPASCTSVPISSDVFLLIDRIMTAWEDHLIRFVEPHTKGLYDKRKQLLEFLKPEGLSSIEIDILREKARIISNDLEQ